MHRSLRIIAWLLTLLPGALAAQKTDTIHLFNGDRVIGEMKDLKLGLLRVSTAYMSTVYIEWDQVRTVQTTKRWYVRLRSGAYFDGHLIASPPQPPQGLPQGTLRSSQVIPPQQQQSPQDHPRGHAGVAKQAARP